MSSQFYLGFLYFPSNFYQDKKLKIYQGAKKNPHFHIDLLLSPNSFLK